MTRTGGPCYTSRMHGTLTERLVRAHLVEGEPGPGREIALRIDQTLTQDATGTMAYLEFESMGIPRVRTDLSVSYVDHNIIQTDFRNADDHRFLQSAAARFGVVFSPPGNGVSHHVHRERFGRPGRTLLGSDSHTTTGGCLGMLAMGAGGLEIALAMSGEPYRLVTPAVWGIRVSGALPAWVSGKDLILELLRRFSTKGATGKVLEFFGPGVAALDLPARATIANMSVDMGATACVFPSDGVTRDWMASERAGRRMGPARRGGRGTLRRRDGDRPRRPRSPGRVPLESRQRADRGGAGRGARAPGGDRLLDQRRLP